jgi:ATP-dependent DNA ligase
LFVRRSLAFSGVPKDPGLRDVRWTEPRLIAEVAFIEWTSDGSPNAVQERRKFFALDEFHREKVTSVNFANVINAADIFVAHLSGHAHFAMKARERRAVAQKMIGKQLERDGLAQFQIISAIDFAHDCTEEH